MPAPRPADHPPPDDPDPVHEIACELLGILPFGARPDTVTRCPRLIERVDAARFDTGWPGGGERDDPAACSSRAAAAVVDAIESFAGSLALDRQPEPLAPELARHMLHVLLATRDLGWPGTDAPLSVRRVAAADLFFDATQTVLSDHDWKGPHGVEFALLTALARRICDATPRRGVALSASSRHDEGRARDTGGEVLGRLRRVQRPRGL
jgi:hypothetical protein